MPLVDKFCLKVFPNVCLFPASERAGGDIEQHGYILEFVAVEVESARLADFLWVQASGHKRLPSRNVFFVFFYYYIIIL